MTDPKRVNPVIISCESHERVSVEIQRRMPMGCVVYVYVEGHEVCRVTAYASNVEVCDETV